MQLKSSERGVARWQWSAVSVTNRLPVGGPVRLGQAHCWAAVCAGQVLLTNGVAGSPVPLRVVRADYLAVIALSVARGKDFARILALLESGSVTRDEIGRLGESPPR